MAGVMGPRGSPTAGKADKEQMPSFALQGALFFCPTDYWGRRQSFIPCQQTGWLRTPFYAPHPLLFCLLSKRNHRLRS